MKHCPTNPPRILFLDTASVQGGGSTRSLLRTLASGVASRYKCYLGYYHPLPQWSQFERIGVESFELSSSLAQNNWVKRIAAGYGLGRIYRLIQSPKLARHLASLLVLPRILLRQLPYVYQITQIIRNLEIDLVHLNNYVDLNFDAILAALFTGTPCVCHLRGLRKLSSLEVLLANPGVTRFIAVSAAAAHCAAGQGIAGDRIRVVYDGRDPIPYDRANGDVKRQEWGLSTTDVAVGYVGRLLSKKGTREFVKAMQQVISSISSAHCIIVGDGPQRLALEQLADESGILDKTLFTGYTDDIPPVMKALDLVCVPSIGTDAFPNTILEAMAAGKPVAAATAPGGIAEQVVDGETGLLVPPASVPALVRAIVTLVTDDDLRHQMGQAGRQRVKHHFSLERNVQETIAVYEEVFERRGLS